MKPWLLTLAVLMVLTPQAEAVELSSVYRQGSLVIGQAAPGTRAELNGKTIEVSPDGAFIFGFGRDAKLKHTLNIYEPGSTVVEFPITLKAQTYDIQRIDGLPKRKVTPNPDDVKRIGGDNEKIWTVRGLSSQNTRFLSGFVLPLEGRFSGQFGSLRILNGKPKNPHNGLDIAAKKGTPIYAPADGVVAMVHDDMFYTGKTMMIDHGLGLNTVYAHMNQIDVAEGQVVAQGDKIGQVGNTGRTTGPHLHWGLTWKGIHLNPLHALFDLPVN